MLFLAGTNILQGVSERGANLNLTMEENQTILSIDWKIVKLKNFSPFLQEVWKFYIHNQKKLQF